MNSLRRLSVAGILMLACGIALGQGRAGNDPSQEVIKELMAHLPKGVKTGNQLPPFVKKAVKRLADLSSIKVEVEALFARLVVVTDMNRYLDYLKVTDPKLRDLIKKRYTAFTIDQRWPIYLNGESDLYRMASEIESAENPVAYKLAVVLCHEMVHAQGQSDEAIAIQEEIKMLGRLLGRRLVEPEWVSGRIAELAQIRKGQKPRGPLQVTTSKP